MALTDQLGANLPSITTLTSGGMMFILTVAIGLLLLVILWVLMYVTKFNIRVDVEERRGKNILEYTTRGGIIKNKVSGVKEFVIWRGNWNPSNPLRSSLPTNDFYRINKKGKPILRILKDSVDTYQVIPPTKPNSTNFQTITVKKNKGFFKKNPEYEQHQIAIVPPLNDNDLPKPTSLDWYNWAGQTLKGLAPRYRNDKGWLRENAGLVAFGGVLVAFIFMVIIFADKWEEGSGNLRATAESVAKTTESLARVQSGAKGIQTIESDTGNVENRQIIEAG